MSEKEKRTAGVMLNNDSRAQNNSLGSLHTAVGENSGTIVTNVVGLQLT